MRTRLNVTIDAATLDEARSLGLNLSRLAEAAIAEASRAERNRRWVAENRAALDAYAARIEADGPALASHRLF